MWAQDLAKELNVAIGKGRGGTLAPSVSATAESVGCTGCDLNHNRMMSWRFQNLLSRELEKAA